MTTTKKSFKTKALSLLLCLSCILGSMIFLTSNASAASCSNWETYYVGTPRCESPRCGFLWAYPENHMQTVYKKRKCLNAQGDVYYEYDSTNIKLGCCE
jgi:hypothetical protein